MARFASVEIARPHCEALLKDLADAYGHDPPSAFHQNGASRAAAGAYEIVDALTMVLDQRIPTSRVRWGSGGRSIARALDRISSYGSTGSAISRAPVPRAHYQIQTLALLGLGPSNVICTYPGIKITASELVVPSHSGQHEAAPRWSIKFLRESFLRQASGAGNQKKVFLDRGLGQRRQIVNQTEVREYLNSRGYAIVDPASLSFQEQVSLFPGARLIVSCHGAGLANLCFVETGTRLLEIFSPFYTPDYFRVLSQHLGVLYGCISGVPVGGRAGVPERQRIKQPFKLPLDRLTHAVENLERLA